MDPFGNHLGDGATRSDPHRNTDPCSRKDRRALVDRADTEHRYSKAGRLDVLTYAMAMLMSNVRNLHSIHARRRAGIGRLKTVERREGRVRFYPWVTGYRAFSATAVRALTARPLL